MSAYYNEIEPKAAAWLRELIADGLIAHGHVDTRSIEDIVPSDLDGYTQCHFFAGIGGWSYALRLAGWPDNRPVWTGSCPCQPFSASGKGTGFDDQRHLWPSWHWIIGQRRPERIYGEQVAGRAGLEWWDLVSTDLEGVGYACAAANLPAAGVGTPHRRQRHFFVAMPNTNSQRRHQRHAVPCVGAEAHVHFIQGRAASGTPEPILQYGSGEQYEPAPSTLAYGVSQRMGLLRGPGNAIVPQIAAEFIRATA